MQREAALSFVDASVALPFIRSGELRPLAITAAAGTSYQSPSIFTRYLLPFMSYSTS